MNVSECREFGGVKPGENIRDRGVKPGENIRYIKLNVEKTPGNLTLQWVSGVRA